MAKSYLHMLLLAVLLIFGGAACSSSEGDNGGGGTSSVQIPDKAGMTVKGIVRDDAGAGIAGVVVSDGLKVTTTDADGVYYLPSDLARRHFVFVSIPSGYEVSATQSCPRFYRRIDAGQSVNRADFTLTRREASADRHSLIVMADIQLSADNASETSYLDYVVPDVLKTVEGLSTEVYGISLGDLVWNDMSLYPKYRQGLETMGFTTFSLPGNHDHDPAQPTDSLALESYERYFGPANYSVNIGKIHYVFLDNVLFDSHTPGKDSEYGRGLTDEICEWLEADLSHVPEGSTLVVSAHCPILYLTGNSEARNHRNYQRFVDAISPYRVHAFGGHKHYHDTYRYDDGQKVMHCVARTPGDLYINGDVNCDGTPRGYVVVDVDGEELSWYYKSVGEPQQMQMRLYAPGRTNSDYVYANIWGYDTRWSEVTWIPDTGGPGVAMERTQRTDPYYEELLATGARGGTPTNTRHMFRVRPGAERSGTVRVTDSFGRTSESSVAW